MLNFNYLLQNETKNLNDEVKMYLERTITPDIYKISDLFKVLLVTGPRTDVSR
jgi:hypothetical protein